MRYFFLVVALMLMAGPAVAADKACTEMWCKEGLTLVLQGTDWPAGHYEFYIKADDDVVTCEGTLPLSADCQPSAHCSHPDWRVGESGCALPPEQHSFHEISSIKTPQHVRVQITGPDGRVTRTEMPVEERCAHPNGPACDAHACCSAAMTVPMEWR